MAQIRNYQKGVYETKSLAKISQVTDSTNTFLQFDGILTNAFSNLALYADAGGASPLPLTSYSSTTTDDTATALEAETSTGGSGYTVYSQMAVTDATYQNVDLYATFTNFGTYTDNNAAFNQMGAEIEISSSQTVALSDGAIKTFLTVDTSSGDVTATLPSGDFVGQRITVICSGSNIAYVEDYALIDGSSTSFVWDSSLWVTEVPRMVRAEYKGNPEIGTTSNITFGTGSDSFCEDTHSAYNITTGEYAVPQSMVYKIIFDISRKTGGEIIVSVNGTEHRRIALDSARTQIVDTIRCVAGDIITAGTIGLSEIALSGVTRFTIEGIGN